jgi:hypothetical protein
MNLIRRSAPILEYVNYILIYLALPRAEVSYKMILKRQPNRLVRKRFLMI